MRTYGSVLLSTYSVWKDVEQEGEEVEGVGDTARAVQPVTTNVYSAPVSKYALGMGVGG
eukprot:CAMPEP_0173169714 /NCGR_PEP_ID=MMETSP1141-20130122/858_1 /TAXON_ID=483371 /ORGANISM="non described non described, Strain CCMP2298" /LENGTH=58 /DNA_ID=CAMNT_0014091573 /DNA_START=276 /DNA_END=452 /DNA_ORIENTATION=+